ncbi:hypothetical protein OEA41_006183 [Lepraria neglecta]|uniref:Uncharacterized protein n=1 Tax=Lepraria neglecta TaxID=209136 RepID=A0AAE0DMU1_9LECA|nr:hypothetical protein OEA41_006183 [Lepraria neglecta]
MLPTQAPPTPQKSQHAEHRPKSGYSGPMDEWFASHGVNTVYTQTEDDDPATGSPTTLSITASGHFSEPLEEPLFSSNDDSSFKLFIASWQSFFSELGKVLWYLGAWVAPWLTTTGGAWYLQQREIWDLRTIAQAKQARTLLLQQEHDRLEGTNRQLIESCREQEETIATERESSKLLRNKLDTAQAKNKRMVQALVKVLAKARNTIKCTVRAQAKTLAEERAENERKSKDYEDQIAELREKLEIFKDLFSRCTCSQSLKLFGTSLAIGVVQEADYIFTINGLKQTAGELTRDLQDANRDRKRYRIQLDSLYSERSRLQDQLDMFPRNEINRLEARIEVIREDEKIMKEDLEMRLGWRSDEVEDLKEENARLKETLAERAVILSNDNAGSQSQDHQDADLVRDLIAEQEKQTKVIDEFRAENARLKQKGSEEQYPPSDHISSDHSSERGQDEDGTSDGVKALAKNPTVIALIEKLEMEQARAHSLEQKVEELIVHLEVLQVKDSEKDDRVMVKELSTGWTSGATG